MNVVDNYFAYADEVHVVRGAPGFPAFLTQFTGAFYSRLTALGIALYAISEVRAVEAAAFELASRTS